MLCGFIFCLSGLLLPRYFARRRRALRTRKAYLKAVLHQTKITAPTEKAAEARKNFVLIKEI